MSLKYIKVNVVKKNAYEIDLYTVEWYIKKIDFVKNLYRFSISKHLLQ